MLKQLEKPLDFMKVAVQKRQLFVFATISTQGFHPNFSSFLGYHFFSSQIKVGVFEC